MKAVQREKGSMIILPFQIMRPNFYCQKRGQKIPSQKSNSPLAKSSGPRSRDLTTGQPKLNLFLQIRWRRSFGLTTTARPSCIAVNYLNLLPILTNLQKNLKKQLVWKLLRKKPYSRMAKINKNHKRQIEA